jgi:hypothetical protein
MAFAFFREGCGTIAFLRVSGKPLNAQIDTFKLSRQFGEARVVKSNFRRPYEAIKGLIRPYMALYGVIKLFFPHLFFPWSLGTASKLTTPSWAP